MRVAGVATGRGSSVCGVPPLLPSDLLPCRSLPSFHRLQSIKVSLPCKSKKSQQQQRQWHSSATTATASLRDVENMLRAAEIKTIAPRDAQSLLLSSPNNNNSSSQSYKMLDVRPIWEREKAHVVGSIHVPLFIEDVDTSALTLLKKWIQMGYGGMWMGQRLTVKNTDFVDQVEDHLPSKEQRLMVVCGEGLRCSGVLYSFLHLRACGVKKINSKLEKVVMHLRPVFHSMKQQNTTKRNPSC
ncbi:hypothetical protein CY35_03G047000 [Sphagnum magellanicum]|nr:hypothetical protein CY35_03G047000 [Sphagnum magellanicum]